LPLPLDSAPAASRTPARRSAPSAPDPA
jgi:hypothetical protein